MDTSGDSTPQAAGSPASRISVLPLGAAQSIGGSCFAIVFSAAVHLTQGGTSHGNAKAFIVDFGVAWNAPKRMYCPPDLTLLHELGIGAKHIQAVIITHFHSDHCGGVPALREQVGYHGLVAMTPPTATAAADVLASIPGPGRPALYTPAAISAALASTTPLSLSQPLQGVTDEGEPWSVQCWPAGHVPGAVMVCIEFRGLRAVYSGDYSMSPGIGRMVPPAQIPAGIAPRVFITETTYITTARAPRILRDRQLLQSIRDTVAGGGSVLIPVWSASTAHELLHLVSQALSMAGSTVPIYMSGGLETIADTYSAHQDWLLPSPSITDDSIAAAATLSEFIDEPAPDASPAGAGDSAGAKGPAKLPRWLAAVRPAHPSCLHSYEGCVLLATTGDMSGGMSLSAFEAWHKDAKNLIILPGQYPPTSIPGQLGSTDPGVVDGKAAVRTVRCGSHSYAVGAQCLSLGSSVHTDGVGVVDAIMQLAPQVVIPVHGSEAGAAFLSAYLRDHGIECRIPQYGVPIQL